MKLQLLPIQPMLQENTEFLNLPECEESLEMSVAYYACIGYHPPWIGYFVRRNGTLVGTAGFKGKPVGGQVEVAYGTFSAFQGIGIGAAICTELVQLAKATDLSVRIMARTLPLENYSTRILRKNGFVCQGIVVDKDDGDVWEWEYQDASSSQRSEP